MEQVGLQLCLCSSLPVLCGRHILARHCRAENLVAIDLITQHIRMKLQQPDLRRIYHNLEVIPSNYQIKGMHTIVRDRETNKTDFVFYSDRLLRLVSIVAGSSWRCRGALLLAACSNAAWLFPSGRWFAYCLLRA